MLLDHLNSFTGGQLAYGYALGPLTHLYGPDDRPTWLDHPDGPVCGAVGALLSSVGINDPGADPALTLVAWKAIEVDFAPYGDPAAPGWILSALTYCCSFEGPLGITDPQVPEGAHRRLTAALAVLGLTKQFARLKPEWWLCARTDLA